MVDDDLKHVNERVTWKNEGASALEAEKLLRVEEEAKKLKIKEVFEIGTFFKHCLFKLELTMVL